MPGLNDVIAAISERRGGATELPAIALSVTLDPQADPDDPMTLTSPVAVIQPVVHPDLAALLDATSALRRGQFSWSLGLGEDCDPTALRVLLDHVHGDLVFPKHMTETTRGPADLSRYNNHGRQDGIRTTVAGTPAQAVFTRARMENVTSQWRYGEVFRPGIVTLSGDGRVLWISVRTHRLDVPAEYAAVHGIPQIPLDLRPCGKAAVDPKPQIAAEVIPVLDWARAVGIEVIEDPAVARLERTAARNVAAWPTRGRPAEASASVGRFVDPETRAVLGVGAIDGHRSTAIVEVDSATIAAVAGDEATGIHPGVADVAAMSAAAPVVDHRLKDYQAEIVGLHLATKLGYVNALPTGMGKTITTLASHRLRAAGTPGWRGLVIVEANVREQWTEQTAKWFPEAHVVTVDSRKDAATLTETLATAGNDPVLVICSYTLASDSANAQAPSVEAVEPIAAEVKPRRGRRLTDGQMALFDVSDGRVWVDAVASGAATSGLGGTLLGVRWDDLVADEAIGLRGTGTKLATALWRLRANSEVATALTGTPIVKGLDDIGRLLAWARNDADMFRGKRLSKIYDISTDEGLDGFMRAIGPLVVRRDKSELDGELPEMRAEVVRLEPTTEEKALATAARQELKRVYDELVAWMSFAETTREGAEAEELRKAKEALVAARGAWLGGTTLARMAASDPESLIGSTSAGAALLASQGLIADAIDNGGTKREWCLRYCTRRVANGDKILIFTDFATVARGLIADLTEAGVAVGAVLGGGGKARDRDIAAFRNGELDVLVCTNSGERGLNLQVANVIVHYDLRWTPDGIVQRTGRVQRIGSTVDVVDVVFPLMTGTIEERVAALVVARAMTSLRALDTSRGIAAADTELGRALGSLVDSVDASEVDGSQAGMLAMTRELFAVAA